MRLFALLALALACAFPAAAAPVCLTVGATSVVDASWPAIQPGASGSWAPCPPTAGITPAQFLSAVKTAASGDTLVLAPGVFPAVTIRGLAFSPPLTITSADPAHMAEINGLDFLGSTGLRLLGVDIHETNPISAQSPVLNLVGSSDVQVTGGKIRGTRDAKTGLLMGKGAVITGGSNILISGEEITDLFKGVSLADVADATIQGNAIHNVRTSPVDGGGLIVRGLVTGNHIYGIVPVDAQGDHSDGIHFFTKSGSPITGLTISNNLMECPGDCSGTLGINLEGTPSPGGFVNVKVIGNTLRWNNNQGLTENYIVSGEFSGNQLYPAPGLDNPAHAPGIVLRATNGPNFKVFGNTSKLGPSLKPYAAQNTILTAAQITAMGATVAPH